MVEHQEGAESPVGQRFARTLRSCLGQFATGVCVVTFEGPEGPRGFTVNSFTSVSMTPPIVLVSVARRAKAHDALAGSSFAINVLGAEQEGVARRFAGGAEVPLSWIAGRCAPRLAGVLAYLDCTPWRTYPGGDHTLFLGQVEDFDHRDGSALGYHASGFTRIGEDPLGHEHLIS